MQIAKKHRDDLERIKEAIQNSHENFKENIDRFNDFKRMVFVTSLSDNELTMLKTLKKPIIEFPILEAYISRLRGEFSKQEPSITVSARDGADVEPGMLRFLEDHMRNILDEANKQGLEYKVYTDTLAGGYSVVKVYTDYTTPMSFHQDIYIERVYDPTMTGFDPIAMKEDKSDGDYCFEIFPMKKSDFERRYPEVSLAGVNYGKALGAFRWSYETGSDKIILLADYYEKRRKKIRICMLANGNVMTMDEYKKFVEQWEADGNIAQPPAIVGKPRWTEEVTICRYKLIETEILSYEETSYKSLPLVFIDGNSVVTRQHEEGAVKQVTRPYIYNAKGAQKLKNFAGSTLANELENMSMAKLAMPKDGIPPAYKEAYNDPQRANVYIYNAFKDDDPNVPLPAPIFLQRPQVPQEIGQTFMMADALTQNILGSFDASMTKLTEQQISGVALQETATLSNAAAMPYVVSFMRGLQTIGERIMELIPIYYKTPRTIPVTNDEGIREYVAINQEGGVQIDFDHNAIAVKIEAGLNFGIQKTRALQQIVALMNTSPTIAEFVNDVGIHYVLDNIEMRGVDGFKADAKKWMEMRQQAKMKQMQQPSPEQQMIGVAQKQVEAEHEVGMARVQVQAASESTKAQLKEAEMVLQREKNQVELAKILAEMQNERLRVGIEVEKAQMDKMDKVVDASIKASEHQHDVADREFDRAIRSLEHVASREDAKHEREAPIQ